TRTWWEHRLPLFDVYVSPVVLEEARQGDPEPARRRLEVLASFPVLEATPAYDFQCQEAATDFLHFLFPLVLCTACIGRAGARKRRRLSMLISVDWVPSSLRPSGTCLALGPRVCFSLLTPSRVTPHRGCVSSDGRVKTV